MLSLGGLLLVVAVVVLWGKRLSPPGALSSALRSTRRSTARPRLERSKRPTVHDRLAAVLDGELVTLTGRIQSCGETLTAPLSGAACAAYLAVAQSRHGDGVSRDVDLQEMKIAPLVIAVCDGSVTVEGECVVALRTSAVSPRALERERAFLAKRQLSHFLPSTDFAEATLCVDDRIWVRGVALREIAGEHGYRDRPERMRLVSQPGLPLTLGRSRDRLPAR